jgi:hypothetical protein
VATNNVAAAKDIRLDDFDRDMGGLLGREWTVEPRRVGASDMRETRVHVAGVREVAVAITWVSGETRARRWSVLSLMEPVAIVAGCGARGERDRSRGDWM